MIARPHLPASGIARGRYILLAIGLLAVLVISFAVQVVAGVIVAAGLLLVALPWFWLSRNWHLHASIGALLYLTILRPLPDIGNEFLYDRLLDGAWFLLVTAMLGYQFAYKRRRLHIWSGSFWLILGSVVVIVSILVGGLLGQPVIARDFRELYRGPYYFLVIVAATQVAWDDEDLGGSLFVPLLAGLSIAFLVSVVQNLGGAGIEIVSPIYTPNSAESVFNAFSSHYGSGYGFYLQNSGTFANPNWWGVALGVLLPFLMAGWFMRGRRRLRIMILGTGVVAFALICASGSRTGLFVGTLAVFGFFGLWVLESWKRPSVAHVSTSWVSRWAPLSFFVLAVAVLFTITAIKGERYHDTIATVVRVVTGSTEFGELRDALDDIKIGSRTDVSGPVKLDGAIRAFREAWARSPLIGLGPSKGVDQYLGDNQYSKLFYRYGIVGFVVWFGFWFAVLWRTLNSWRRATTPVQAAMLRAVLVSVPLFLFAGVLGAFFDARQIATLFLILIGVAMSCRGQIDKRPALDVSGKPSATEPADP